MVMIQKRKMGLKILTDRKMKMMKIVSSQEAMMIMNKNSMMKKMLTQLLMKFGLKVMSILEKGPERMIFLIKMSEGFPNSTVITKLLKIVFVQLSKIKFMTFLSLC